MIEIPLSQIGTIPDFVAALKQHRDALEQHVMGDAGLPAPIARPLVEQLIERVASAGPIADRGPDEFRIMPYRVIDDTPLSAEATQALSVLRETVGT